MLLESCYFLGPCLQCSHRMLLAVRGGGREEGRHSPSRTATPAPRRATFMGAMSVQVLFSGL